MRRESREDLAERAYGARKRLPPVADPVLLRGWQFRHVLARFRQQKDGVVPEAVLSTPLLGYPPLAPARTLDYMRNRSSGVD